MIDILMDQLAKDLELETPLSTEVPGVYVLPLEEDVSVTVTPLEPLGVTMRCDFAPCPEEGPQEELFTEALLANLFGQGTKGAVLGLNDEKKWLTLVQDIPYDVDYREFSEILEDFINTVDFWRSEVKNYKP